MMGPCYKTPILKNVLEIASWYRRNHPKPLAPPELFEKFLDRMDDEDLEFAVEMSQAIVVGSESIAVFELF